MSGPARPCKTSAQAPRKYGSSVARALGVALSRRLLTVLDVGPTLVQGKIVTAPPPTAVRFAWLTRFVLRKGGSFGS